MSLLDNIFVDTGGYSSPTLRQELSRRPWLSIEEQIALAVESATEFLHTEDEFQEAVAQATENGRAEGEMKGRDEALEEAEPLAVLLREIVNGDVDPADMREWEKRAARAVAEFDNYLIR